MVQFGSAPPEHDGRVQRNLLDFSSMHNLILVDLVVAETALSSFRRFVEMMTNYLQLQPQQQRR
jgi:hypothetical protein